MYEGDTPNAERRAAALALDRDLLRELLGQEELRELIDPEALDDVERSLQHLNDESQAQDRDALQQILRRLGDLTPDECEERVVEGYSAASMLGKLERERNVALVRIAGEERWIAAEDAGLYRDALGVPPPPGLPESFGEEVEDAMLAPRPPLRAHPRSVPDRAARRPLRRRPDAGAARARARGRPRPRRAPARRHRARVVRLGRPAAGAPRLARAAAPGGRGRRPGRARPLPAELAERRRAPPRGRRPGPPARGARAAAGRRADARGLGARRPAAPARRLQPGLARPAHDRRRGRLDRRRRGRPLGPGRALLPRGRPRRRARRPRTRSSSDPRARSTT